TDSGIALGAWGAVQASAAGVALALGGAVRDGVDSIAASGWLGSALTGEGIGYSTVYHIEVFLLFVALVALEPIARHAPWTQETEVEGRKFGLAAFPE
ncbi:MAG: PucC family protein, partial [Pseudomonadota bacterium]